MPRTRQLLVKGQSVKLSARAFDLLLALAEQAGEVVSKQALLERAWPGLVVEENNLHLHISNLRKLVGHEAIATVAGRGYLLASAALVPRLSTLQARTGLPSVPQGTHSTHGASSTHGRRAAAAPRPATAPPELPLLFGREGELASLARLLAQGRLVTVVGPGGVGKTRLALEAARTWHARHGLATCVAELSGTLPGASLAEAVAQAVGMELPGLHADGEELAHVLQHRALLLVLDNCEHRLDEVAALAERLMRHCRGLRILATSQAPLRTESERTFMLAPLPVPPARATSEEALRHPAVSFFCARVAALTGHFALAADNVQAVVAICRALEGLPLAIELASARVPLLGVHELCARLTPTAQAPGNALSLLAGGSRSLMPRHQTLRSAIDWSHSLLDPARQQAFRRLGIFVGPFSLRSALEVLDDGQTSEQQRLDLLGGLVERSLLVVDCAEPPHYRLLESTRAFALEKLVAAQEMPLIQQRLAQTMLKRYEFSAQEQWQMIPRRRIQAGRRELDNLRAALRLLDADPEQAHLHIELAGASAWIWPRVALRMEGLRHCRQALQRVNPQTPAALEARLQLASARQSHHRAEPMDLAAAQCAVTLYRQLDNRRELFLSLSVQAVMLSLTPDQAAGEAALAEMETLFDDSWPLWLWGPRTWALGLCQGQWGRLEACSAVADQGLRMARAVNEPTALALALMARAQCDTWMGRTESAVAFGRQGVAMSRADGSQGRLGILLGDLSANLTELGQLEEAREAGAEAIPLRATNGTLWLQLDQLAAFALEQGRLDEAAMALGRADHCHAWSKGQRHFYLRRVHEQVSSRLVQVLSAAVLAALKAHGSHLSDEEVAWLALGGFPGNAVQDGSDPKVHAA